MRILAVGSEGNIGAPLVAYLRSVGHDVFTTDIEPGWRPDYRMADINHPLDLLDAFDWRPDVVYLMAAVVSRVTCEQAGSLAVTTNIAGVNNVLQLTRRVGARLVFFSTSEVYGPVAGVMDEELTRPRPNNRYGLTKWLGEQLVRYEVEQHDLQAVIVRPFMVYGEDEDLGDHRSAMIRFASELAAGHPIEAHRDSARGWLHVSDAVRALEAAGCLSIFTTLNIGHPDIIETVHLAERIRACLGADPELVREVEQPEQMTPVKHPALYRMRTLLGIEPTVGLDEGISRVCARFAGAAT